MKAVLCAVVLAVFLAQASALECYVCSDCILSGFLSKLENSETCNDGLFSIAGQDRCMKSVALDGSVTRSCSNSVACLPETLLRCDGANEKGCVICCDTDNCNSALNVKGAGLAVALALAAAFFAARF